MEEQLTFAELTAVEFYEDELELIDHDESCIEIQIEEGSLIEDEIDLNDSQLIGLNSNYAEAQSSISNACDAINQVARGTIGESNNSQKFNYKIIKDYFVFHCFFNIF